MHVAAFIGELQHYKNFKPSYFSIGKWAISPFLSDQVTNQHYNEHSISPYHELPEILWSILIAACVLLWQQGKIRVSIYSKRDKVVDFPKSGHKCG